MCIKLWTSCFSGSEVGGSHSKKVKACSGRRSALTPKPMKMVAKAFQAMRRPVFSETLDICGVAAGLAEISSR